MFERLPVRGDPTESLAISLTVDEDGVDNKRRTGESDRWRPDSAARTADVKFYNQSI